MKNRESEQTVVVLANAGDLVLRIAQQVLGNEVADSFNGAPLTAGLIQNLAQTEFQQAITKQIGD
ncbi:hypothetical protein D3C71_78400 [compost metagenome]